MKFIKSKTIIAAALIASALSISGCNSDSNNAKDAQEDTGNVTTQEDTGNVATQADTDTVAAKADTDTVVAPADTDTVVAQAADVTACEDFGPQTPRDIDNIAGTNQRVFATAPNYQEMNLCNIHYHNNAEHKAKDFSIYAGSGDNGHGGGYQCSISKSLTEAELAPTAETVCKGLEPGDTIEVHWVHTSCDIKPGQGLGSCLSDSCTDPLLRVETQVFTVVNDPEALDFNDLTYQGNVVKGLHQAKALPTNTGIPIEFLGSTTGPKYTEQECSPLEVTWSVRPKCAKVDINSLGQWCKDNVFAEDHAHGVRKLVTNPKLLSEIK